MANKSPLKKLLKKQLFPKWLYLVLAIVVILRLPSLFEPFSYGDEMIYLVLGEAVKQGKTLYLHIHDNKPPLLYLTAALAGSVFWFRAILAIWSLATIMVFYKLSNHLFPKNNLLQIVSVIVFSILTTIPLLEGNIANAEVFMIGPTILAFYLLLSRKNSIPILFASGVLFSISALFKMPAAFELPVIFVYWLIVSKNYKLKTITNIIYKFAIVVAGFVLPILVTIAWYYLKGAGWDYIVAAYLQNVGYLSSFRPDDKAEPFLIKNLPLILRGAVVGVTTLMLWFFRKKLSKEYILLFIWLLFGLFAVALSERPYPHYLIQVVPSIALFAGMLASTNNIEQSLSIIPLFMAVFVPYYYNFWHYPTISYYTRFYNYATGNIDKSEYFSGFGGNVVRNYKISNYLNKTMDKDDNVFVWGDNASIYALTKKLPPNKYAVDYHIHDFYTKKAQIDDVITAKPEIIVVQSDSEEFAELDKLLNQRYFLINTIDKAEVWKLEEL